MPHRDSTDRELLFFIAEGVIAMSASIDQVIAELQADSAAQGTAFASLQTYIAGFPAALAAAVAAASAAGATPAQLASLDTLSASFASTTAQMLSDVPAPPVVAAGSAVATGPAAPLVQASSSAGRGATVAAPPASVVDPTLVQPAPVVVPSETSALPPVVDSTLAQPAPVVDPSAAPGAPTPPFVPAA
jgi:hypothetical protein